VQLISLFKTWRVQIQIRKESFRTHNTGEGHTNHELDTNLPSKKAREIMGIHSRQDLACRPGVGIIAGLGLLVADEVHDLVLPLPRGLVARQDHLATVSFSKMQL
jgi:hypothetical protein